MPTRLVRKMPETPIVLVQARGRYYIADGNHRFFWILATKGGKRTILAWILEEGDQEQIHGAPHLSLPLQDWKEGKETLGGIAAAAAMEYRAIEREYTEFLRAHGIYVAADDGSRKKAQEADHRQEGFSRPEMNDPGTWRAVLEWADRELRLSPRQEALALVARLRLQDGEHFCPEDVRACEWVYAKALRCGFTPPPA